ncbi:MAG: DMT family transporter [Tissierellia bacterium]|nr:DMT family transporter [Tissierellia bacterium]
MEKIFQNKKTAILIALFCMLLWGSAFPVLKISYQELGIVPSDYMSKIYFAGLRFFLAGIIVIFYGKFITKEKVRFKDLDFKFLLLIGLIQTTFQYLFYYIALGNTTGIKASILQSASTFMMVLLAHFFFKDDKKNRYKLIALLFGFLGIIVANISKGFDMNFKITGEGFMLISSTLGAIGTIIVKKKGSKMSPIVMTCGQMILGSIILLIVGKLGMKGSLNWTPLSIGLLIYSGFISSTAFTLWYFLLKYNKAGEIAVYRLFIPIMGAMLSAIFIPGEGFTVNLISGLILVVIGIYILNRGDRPKELVKDE